jgi:hypothetical protein
VPIALRMSVPRPFPPLYPRLQPPHFPTVRNTASPSTSTPADHTHPPEDKNLSDIDQDELAYSASNTQIASFGATYLRPPGLDPAVSAGYYADQEQSGEPSHVVDDTFVAEEDEEGFIITEEGDDVDDEDEYEEVS